MISLKIDQEQLRRLEGMVDEDVTREKARLGSLSLPHAGDWLNCAPIKSLGLHLRPSEFFLAVKYKLGLPIYDAEGPGPCPVPTAQLSHLSMGHLNIDPGRMVGRRNRRRDR